MRHPALPVLLFAWGLSSCLSTRDLGDLVVEGEGGDGDGSGGSGAAGTGGAGAGATGGAGAGATGGAGADATGGAGADATGGAGAAGASSSSQPPNWASSLTAVYDFELPGIDVGRDSSGNGLDLLATDNTVGQTAGNIQGMATLVVANQGFLTATHPQLDSDGSSITFGGWMRIDTNGAGSSTLFKRFTNEDGFIGWVSEGVAKCSIAGGGNSSQANTGGLPLLTPAEWVHIVCTYDSTGPNVTIHVDGSFIETQDTAPLGKSGLPVRVGESFPGEMDEVFFATARLPDTSVRRIYACGVDGAKCECDPNDPTLYLNCGRFDPNCEPSRLAPCNQTSP